MKHCVLVWSILWWAIPLCGQNRAEVVLQQAELLFDSLKYQEATGLAMQCLKNQKEPQIAARALVLLGDIAVDIADYDSAAEDYQRAIQKLKAFQGKGHPLIAQAWNGLGECALNSGNFSEALHWHRRALQLRLQLFGPNHEKTADSYNNIGNCQIQLGDYGVARQMHQKALKVRKAILPPTHPDIAVSHNNLGNCAYFSGEFKEAAREYRAALAIREKTYGVNHVKVTSALNNLGKVLYEMGQWDQAMAIFQRVLGIRQKAFGPNNSAIAPTLENIGEVLLEKRDFSAAIPYLQQAVFLYGGSKEPISAAAWHKIGLCYQRSGNYDKALVYHLAALEPIKSLYGNQVFAASIHSNIGVCYLLKVEFAQSILNLSMAANILHQYYPQGHPDLAQIHNSLALCYLGQGFLDTAELQSKKAIFALHQIGQTKGLGYAQVLRTRAEIFLQRNLVSASSALLEKALKAVDYHPGQTYWGNELTLEVMKILAQQARTWKAEALSAKSKQNTLYWQKKAANTYAEALQLMGVLRSQMSSSNSRQNWLEQQYSLYREATELNFRIWQQTKQEEYLEKAFLLSEKSKGAQLLEAVQKSQAKAQVGGPPKFEKMSDSLRTRLAELESEKLSRPINAAKLEREMLGLMRQLDGVQKSILNWQKKRGIQLPSDTVYTAKILRKKLLRRHQAMVEYFETESSFLVFVLKKSAFSGFEVPKSSAVLQEVIDFRSLLRLYPALNGTALDSNILSWIKLSWRMHQNFVAPVRSSLKEVNELIIIPDGALGYLPFEALLTRLPKKISRFKSHAYLLRQYAIQYNYSGSLAWELEQKRHSHLFKPSLLSMAPHFQGDTRGLSPLYNTFAEARKLGKLWDAKVLLGRAASLEAFQKQAPNYQILHMATHGIYVREAANLSALAFVERKDTLNNEYLFTQDLYAMRLPAEMVVLSACETGIGDYHQGEGIISLAHGFIHAGAQSVVTTLWSVDDVKTAELVVGFFQNLKKGQNRPFALQQAKLDLLRNHPNDEVHPYYWAGLIGIGTTQPLYAPIHKLLVLTALASALLGLAWLVIRYISKKRSE